jgi:ribosomal-protein-alanine N-acetyltransferase
MPDLETARLRLTPVTVADAAQTQQIFPHWEIVQYLAGVPWPYPADGALRYYEQVVLPAMAREEEFQWVLRLKNAPERHVGAISLYPAAEENQRGFWLGLPWQRQGLMMEAVMAVNDFWFGELGRGSLRAPKAVANVGSRRISEKTGMRLTGTCEREYVSGRVRAEIWEQTAAEWIEARVRLARPGGDQ